MYLLKSQMRWLSGCEPWANNGPLGWIPAIRELGLGLSQLDCKAELHFLALTKPLLYLRRCVRNKNLRSPFAVIFFILSKSLIPEN